ncbi:hypothetical protein NFB56_16165 [Yersinia ruckeri]|uniref:hypothetical protein n=1 Tax=Yersinia ruckeri TaxID=29486 RepID=UPI0022370948|nr:hypothetical protein [Yersinia ruckeri]MCW6550374.1 hypothetical protein [Yersinia ruckeri]
MITITLNQIRAASPCTSGWKKVLKAHEYLGMDTPFPLSSVLESNDLAYTLWCLGALDNKEIPQRFALWCARQVETEESKKVLDVVERYLDGTATKDELIAARRAAYAADAAAAYAAAAAANAAAYAAAAAAAAAAANAAAYAAAAAAANAAAYAAAAAAAYARQAQVAKLKEMLS